MGPPPKAPVPASDQMATRWLPWAAIRASDPRWNAPGGWVAVGSATGLDQVVPPSDERM